VESGEDRGGPDRRGDSPDADLNDVEEGGDDQHRSDLTRGVTEDRGEGRRGDEQDDDDGRESWAHAMASSVWLSGSTGA